MSHPTREEIELFVLRAYDQIAFDGIEAHFSSCDACTKRLSAEAELELGIREAAEAAAWCPRCDAASSHQTCPRCGVAIAPGGYAVESVVAEHAQGRTYIAMDAAGARVRMSELIFTHVSDHGVIDAFEKEIRLLGQLDHPAIPKLVDGFREGDDEQLRLYAVEEHIEGEALDEYLARHRMDEAEAVDIARQVLDVLIYLHGLSPAIYHRDIRPQNLLRTPEGRIVVRQFAHARDMTTTGVFTLVGHSGYIPAEQHLGVVDATSDLYGLAATLVHLLTRRAPLPSQPELERANVSDEFRRWLERMMAKRPRDRFESAVAARIALLTPDAVLPRRKKPRGWLYLLAAAAFIAGGTLAGNWVLQGSSTPKPPAPSPTPVSIEHGRILVESTPTGASVELDPQVRDAHAQTPMEIVDLRYGSTHSVKLTLPGYKPWTRTFTMDESMDGVTLRAALVRISAPEEVVPPKPRRAPPPPRDGGVSTRSPTASACVTKPDQPPGFLTVTTTPYSEIFWGQRSLGQTPIARVAVPSGCLELRAVSLDGSKTRRVEVVVQPNHTGIYRFNLDD